MEYFSNLFSKYNQTIRSPFCFAIVLSVFMAVSVCVWIFNQNAVREVFAVFQLLVFPLLLLLSLLLLVSNTKRA